MTPREGIPDRLPHLTQDYLKAIFQLSEWDKEPVTATRISSELGLKPSTTTEGLKRLESQGLIRREPYKPIELTNDGRKAAVEMVRRHRLIETFLVRSLGYSWDEVHDEAERLEHAVSPTFVERIADALGNPDRDPHGDPIPDAKGRIATASVHSLAIVATGEDVVVERISDRDPELLRYLEAHGIVPGAGVAVAERPYPSMLHVAVADAIVPISAESAELVRIRNKV
ncbi:metal-dependent transcriptional regulator [Corynebacterium sp. Marseille-P4321]|uniref:metal-dependent transcriptional regulator n=1 Tax=Corynebacterium sp. Marseille-P4321 TaxID=2736603 RepID=UPI00089324F8|nr:metal-dependent transcriptional regulator [Corynebacterium sp. Marseille-P4321]OEY24360.1 transcriptional regulator [Corynebacterium sp. BCW_4722]